jgi:hypothetical protein
MARLGYGFKYWLAQAKLSRRSTQPTWRDQRIKCIREAIGVLPTSFTGAQCRRVHDPSLPRPLPLARTVRATIKIVQTATGEAREIENVTSGVGVTEMSIGPQGPDGTGTAILNGALGGLLPRSRGHHEGRGIRGPSHPPRGEDGRVPALGRGRSERMRARMRKRTRARKRENRTLGTRGCWPLLPKPSRLAKARMSC